MTFKLMDTNEDGEPTHEVKEAYLDGYAFGDRLLEGVWFGFRVTPDGKNIEAFLPPDSAEYMERLNSKFWLERAREYALDLKCFYLLPDEVEETVILFEDC